MKKKLRILTELLLKRLPDPWQERISLGANKMKRRLAALYTKTGWFSSWISACDFIIVRTNGDKFIEFELTNICNAQCVFCPYPDMLRTDKKFMNMTPSILSKSIERINGFKSALISFTPTTGDTLLHPEWDQYISRILEQKGIAKATIFTNAIKLDKENAEKFIQLLRSDTSGKMSQLYFSVGGLEAITYKALYKVDRFELVKNNINDFLGLLKREKMSRGIHIHVKLLKGQVFDEKTARALFNPNGYPFVYFSHSSQYFSNDGYKRNAIIDYYPDEMPEKKKACSYLNKTRFAADGSIWADGCVISEMPGDSSLKLGSVNDDAGTIEKNRMRIITDWEKRQIIPRPCQGCTVYWCKPD
jgi:hypothetical protein